MKVGVAAVTLPAADRQHEIDAAASAMRARRRQSGQLADHRSGTLVAERPDEQLAPKMPIFSALALYMAMRSRIAAERADTTFSIRFRRCSTWRVYGRYGPSSLS